MKEINSHKEVGINNDDLMREYRFILDFFDKHNFVPTPAEAVYLRRIISESMLNNLSVSDYSRTSDYITEVLARFCKELYGIDYITYKDGMIDIARPERVERRTQLFEYIKKIRGDAEVN